MAYLSELSYYILCLYQCLRSLMKEIGSNMNFGEINILDKILSEQDRIIWESMGLTPDIQSMENAALLTKVKQKQKSEYHT